MKNVLVTGGCGFIGSNFVKNLLDNDTDYLPIILDSLTYAGNKNNLDKIPVDKTIPPVGLISVKVDRKNGLRAETNSSNAIFEYFLEEYPPSS